MNNAVMKVSLSPAGARLVELMQWLNHGCIKELAVCGGEPVLTPLPRVVREIKFGGENGPRPEITKTDFEIKAPVRDLFAQFEAMGDGLVISLEIKHGLPFRMTIEGVLA
jgi:hypothetical protein